MFDPAELASKALGIIDQMHEIRRPYFVPTEHSLTQVIKDVFWSSLDRYEGDPLTVRIFFAPIGALTRSANIVRFDTACPVTTVTIRDLSPAHALDGGLLAVQESDGSLSFRGILGSFPFIGGRASPMWLCVESRVPGCFRVCIGSEPILEFTRGIAKTLGGMSLDRTTAEALITDTMPEANQGDARAWQVAAMLLDIGETIERNGRGGAIWILPAGSSMTGDLAALGNRVEMDSSWWEPYEEMWGNGHMDAGTSFTSENDLDLRYAAQQWDLSRREAVIRSVAALSRIDGAIVVNCSPRVLGFGVICHKFGAPAATVLRVTDPSQPFAGEEIPSSEFGGSRHRSAINFCSSHSPAAAVVASHDGGLTVFASVERGTTIGTRVSMISSDAEVQGD